MTVKGYVYTNFEVHVRDAHSVIYKGLIAAKTDHTYSVHAADAHMSIAYCSKALIIYGLIEFVEMDFVVNLGVSCLVFLRLEQPRQKTDALYLRCLGIR